MENLDSRVMRHTVASDARPQPGGAASLVSRRSSTRVAILGGGWSGLAAAVELAEGGVPVTVFEASRTLGGRARRVEVHGLMLDNGLHILIGAYRETLRLIAKVGGKRDFGLLRQPLDLHVLGQFRLRAARLPAPLHLATALLRAQGLSVAERLRAARWMSQLRATNFRLDADVPVALLLARHRQGQGALRHLWEPLCTSALNTAPEHASARVFLNVLRDSLNGRREDSELLLPITDLSALFPEPAARYVEKCGGQVLTGTPVSSLRAHDGGLLVHSVAGASAFSHAICALPPYRVAEVLAELPNLVGVTRAVERLTYEPIYSVYLQYRAPVRLPQLMFALHGGLVQWVFDRGALCGQAGLIGVVISASGAHEDLEQAGLAARVHDELRTHFPELDQPLWSQVIAEKRATFSCVVGVERPSQRTPEPNVHLAGDYTAGDYPATLESAVRSGVACARMILANV
jgi:squalene-associated FAD-dependent desaturase